MKFEKPSRIQATTLPMILQPPFRSLIAQVGSLLTLLDSHALASLSQPCHCCASVVHQS